MCLTANDEVEDGDLDRLIKTVEIYSIIKVFVFQKKIVIFEIFSNLSYFFL